MKRRIVYDKTENGLTLYYMPNKKKIPIGYIVVYLDCIRYENYSNGTVFRIEGNNFDIYLKRELNCSVDKDAYEYLESLQLIITMEYL